jgi:hypothetical protein
MIKSLNLTSREERVLRASLASERPETVGQAFRRLGIREFFGLGLTIAWLIGFILAWGFWYRWLIEGGGFIWLLLLFAVPDAILSPFRLRDMQARAQLIRKLYRALEVRGDQASPGD